MLHEMRDESSVAAVQRVLAARFGIADPSAVDTMILIDAVRDASPPPREMTIASLRAILRTLVPHDGLEGWASECAREIVDMLMRGDREVEGYWCSIEGVLTAMLLRVTRGQDLTAPPPEPKAEAVTANDTEHNLTDEELLRAAGEHTRLTKLNERAYVLPETIELARLASAAANEVIAARRRERRLLEWADQLEANRDKPGDVGKFIAAELRNRMVGR